MKNLIKKLKNPIVSSILIIVVLVGSILGGSFFYLKEIQNRVKIDNSLVNAPIVSVVPTTLGKLQKVLVVEGQKVKKGDALALVGSEVLRAYNDGMVVETSKLIGSLVSSQVSIVKLINPNEMRIAGTLDENKGLNKIKLGQVASFTIDAFPGRTFWGYVDEIAESAKQTSLSFSISSERPTQQFEVYVRFDANKYPEIKNGMSAKMIVFTASN
jgi:multidrug resistance efflux pump